MAASAASETTLLTFRLAEEVFDSVQKVLDPEAGQISPQPKIGTKLRTEFIKGMGNRNHHFLILLDIDRVFSADEIARVQPPQAEAGSGE
jgi:purine-binding chemotaxis protein CheW